LRSQRGEDTRRIRPFARGAPSGRSRAGLRRIVSRNLPSYGFGATMENRVRAVRSASCPWHRSQRDPAAQNTLGPRISPSGPGRPT